MLGATLLAGCASVPFVAVPTPVLHDPDPAAIRSAWSASLPTRFTTEDTVVIEFPGNSLALLGFLRIDRAAGTFEVQGMNHLGWRAFLISGDPLKTEVLFAAPPLVEQPKVLQSIAQDIRRMYFDLVPDQAARVRVDARSVRYTEDRSDAKVEFVMGGADGVLLEKRLTHWIWPVWRVRFYEYTPAVEGVFPRGMVLDNARFHYRIAVKNRSLRIEKDVDTR
ncbi:MAG: hypothetical protein ACYTFA_00360 [Planctomycetota bacterium]